MRKVAVLAVLGGSCALMGSPYLSSRQFVVSPSAYRFAWTSYLGREPRMSDAPNYAAPARRTDLVGLPPAWVGVGDLDVMYPENITYAERLRECGVACERIAVPGMYHGADGLAPKADSMKEFRRSIVNYLRAPVTHDYLGTSTARIQHQLVRFSLRLLDTTFVVREVMLV